MIGRRLLALVRGSGPRPPHSVPPSAAAGDTRLIPSTEVLEGLYAEGVAGCLAAFVSAGLVPFDVAAKTYADVVTNVVPGAAADTRANIARSLKSRAGESS